MAFHESNYDVFLILGDPALDALWVTPQWLRVAAILDPLVKSSRGPAALRSHQIQNQQAVRFGRMGWDEKSHRKWTHSTSSTETTFVSMELWSPSWTLCERQNSPPDFFSMLVNESAVRGNGQLTFNPSIVCAWRCPSTEGHLPNAHSAMLEVARTCQSKLAAWCHRPWGYAAGSGYTDAIQEMPLLGTFRLGDPHARTISLETLERNWAAL